VPDVEPISMQAMGIEAFAMLNEAFKGSLAYYGEQGRRRADPQVNL